MVTPPQSLYLLYLIHRSFPPRPPLFLLSPTPSCASEYLLFPRFFPSILSRHLSFFRSFSASRLAAVCCCYHGCKDSKEACNCRRRCLYVALTLARTPTLTLTLLSATGLVRCFKFNNELGSLPPPPSTPPSTPSLPLSFPSCNCWRLCVALDLPLPRSPTSRL